MKASLPKQQISHLGLVSTTLTFMDLPGTAALALRADADELLPQLCLAPETRVQYFDSREPTPSNAYLNEANLEAKLARLASFFENSVSSPQHEYGDTASPFVLMTTIGSALWPNNALQISGPMLRSLVNAGFVHARLVDMYQQSRSHCSHFVEYDAENTKPVAIHLLLRIPVTDDFIHCAMKIRLKDFACVCLMSALHPVTVESLRNRCIRSVDLLRLCPLYLIPFIVKHTTDGLNARFSTLNEEFATLQTSTGITPLNLFGPASNPIAFFDSTKLILLLRELHEINIKLKSSLPTIHAAANFGPSIVALLEKMEGLRVMTDTEPLKLGHRAQLEDELRHGEVLLGVMKEEVEFNVDRIHAQINVANGLMAQKSSEQNYQIAALTADDSRTMKAITVLTLTFLPGTMLASLWDAGIFTLEQDLSWKVYLATTLGLTTLVFALWGIWMGVYSRKSLADDNDVEESKHSSWGIVRWLREKRYERLKKGGVFKHHFRKEQTGKEVN